MPAWPDHDAGSLLFPKVAKRLRGLVAWVEKPGRIDPGEEVSVRVPEQWIYANSCWKNTALQTDCSYVIVVAS